MTTDNVDGIDGSLATDAEIVAAAERRLQEVRAARRRINQQRVVVDRAAKLKHRRLDDDDEGFGEEEGQLAPIFAPAPTPTPPVVTPTPPVVTPTPPVVTPTPPVVTTTPPDTPVQQPPVVTTTPPDTPVQQPPVVTTTPPDNPPTQPNPLNPRCWSWMQRICAIILGIIALVIASNHRSHSSDWAGIHSGPAVWWIRAGWVILITVFGFLLGGALGWYIGQWFCRTRRTPPPAGPTTAQNPTTQRPSIRTSFRDGFRSGVARTRARRVNPRQVNNPNPPAQPATPTTPPPVPPAAPTP